MTSYRQKLYWYGKHSSLWDTTRYSSVHFKFAVNFNLGANHEGQGRSTTKTNQLSARSSSYATFTPSLIGVDPIRSNYTKKIKVFVDPLILPWNNLDRGMVTLMTWIMSPWWSTIQKGIEKKNASEKWLYIYKNQGPYLLFTKVRRHNRRRKSRR
jgi:hypothetical protein